ncbi:MAG: aldo/keto reductase [Spirochaetaceae bacterium]|nr:aldo/keto reductase [Spirochaetaceae bacterium]
MRYRKLGRTGLECSEIGLGAAQIGIRSVPASTAEHVLRTALEVGVNFIDTAAMYGESETRIGRYLPRDADVIIATKCGDYEVLEDGTPRIVVDYSPASILRIVDESRRRLDRDVLDIVLFHGLPRGDYDADAAFDALLEAKSRGWARFVGVSGDGPAAAMEARRRPLDAQELTYNILYQEADRDLLPALRERGMGVIVKRPIANAAYLSAERPAAGFGESWDLAQRLGLRELAGEMPLVEFALRFTLSRADVSTAIVGTTDPGHLRTNALISDGTPLPADTLARIRDAYDARVRG